MVSSTKRWEKRQGKWQKQWGKRWGKPQKWWGKPQTDFLLNIRLGMLPAVVSTWYPVVSPCVLPGLWLKIRLGMLPALFHLGSHLVCGLKLDWKSVSVVSPKWNNAVVSFSWRKRRTLTLKSCDYSFQPIRRLHSAKSHTSLEKLWDFMQKEFPFKEQSCETALLIKREDKANAEKDHTVNRSTTKCKENIGNCNLFPFLLLLLW